MFDPLQIKRDFPILEREINANPLVYLDNAATTQKPQVVIQALENYYRNYNSNVHRGMHTLASLATEAMEDSRKTVAEFIGKVKPEEIIFTSGTTESLNLLAYSWAIEKLKEGDEIVLSEMEHHANLVPWLEVARKTGAKLVYIPIDEQGRLVLDNIDTLIGKKCKILTLAHMSNVLGTINPIRQLADRAHEVGAIVIVDGAQSAPHLPVNVKDLDVDFYAFSAHKMLGPTGVGVLYGRAKILKEMGPFKMGGEMIDNVYYDKVTWADIPYRFEAGTPNIAGIVAFGKALEYLQNLGMDSIQKHEKKLTEYALKQLSELDFIEIIGPKEAKERGSAISFAGKGLLHPHDISQILDSYGIAIRAGHHCAQPLHRKLKIIATARASFYIYNTEEDVNSLVVALRKAWEMFGL